ncbi:hypothetical protein CHS0354_007460 [Potamilus streckersoni]|uniref:Uncharacterized protein n=1 Tax=Potamilus streckersoni TaxID=2493646 RepID=A0AAE0SVV6_9BIVA|nr:hypothetical protein CHS0354_007460 [Potamilus streckersoni]
MAPAQVEQTLNNQGAANTKLNTYFKTVDKGCGKAFLQAFHPEGCQMIDFGGIENCPRLADIITVFENKGLNETDLTEIRNAVHIKAEHGRAQIEIPNTRDVEDQTFLRNKPTNENLDESGQTWEKFLSPLKSYTPYITDHKVLESNRFFP